MRPPIFFIVVCPEKCVKWLAVAAFVLTRVAGMKIHLSIAMVKDVMSLCIKVRLNVNKTHKNVINSHIHLSFDPFYTKTMQRTTQLKFQMTPKRRLNDVNVVVTCRLLKHHMKTSFNSDINVTFAPFYTQTLHTERPN